MKGNSDEALYAKLNTWTVYKLKTELLRITRQQGQLARHRKMINRILSERHL